MGKFHFSRKAKLKPRYQYRFFLSLTSKKEKNKKVNLYLIFFFLIEFHNFFKNNGKCVKISMNNHQKWLKFCHNVISINCQL